MGRSSCSATDRDRLLLCLLEGDAPDKRAPRALARFRRHAASEGCYCDEEPLEREERDVDDRAARRAAPSKPPASIGDRDRTEGAGLAGDEEEDQ